MAWLIFENSTPEHPWYWYHSTLKYATRISDYIPFENFIFKIDIHVVNISETSILIRDFDGETEIHYYDSMDELYEIIKDFIVHVR